MAAKPRDASGINKPMQLLSVLGSVLNAPYHLRTEFFRWVRKVIRLACLQKSHMVLKKTVYFVPRWQQKTVSWFIPFTIHRLQKYAPSLLIPTIPPHLNKNVGCQP
jgi:hypothetical protein